MVRSPTRNTKLEANPRPAKGAMGQPQSVDVIVRVSTADYVPSFVAVRAQISPQLFTATVQEADLQRLEDDPDVISVSVNRALRTVG